ncbi:MAG: hypothetical protein ABR543_15270 [Gemmatimonadaceae bacterium]
MKDDQYSLRLPRELLRAVVRRGKDRGIPTAQVVREALSQYLAQLGREASPRLVTTRAGRRERPLGTEAGRITISADFDAPLPEEMLREFEQ